VDPDWLEACLEVVAAGLASYSAEECAIVMRAAASPGMKEHVSEAGAESNGVVHACSTALWWRGCASMARLHR
jgi:hypothetical protein